MITFRCSKCQQQYNAPDDLAGRRTVCRHCKQAFIVPSPTVRKQTTTAYPFVCTECNCQFTAPLGSGDEVSCPVCNASVPLPKRRPASVSGTPGKVAKQTVTTQVRVQPSPLPDVPRAQSRGVMTSLLVLLLVWNVLVSVSLGAAGYFVYVYRTAALARDNKSDLHLAPDGTQRADVTNPPPADVATPPSSSNNAETRSDKKSGVPNPSSDPKDRSAPTRTDDTAKDKTKKDRKTDESRDPEDQALSKAIQSLKSGNSDEQVSAAEQLARIGAKAKSATEPLCQALVNASGAKQKQLLEALEKINPGVYEPVVTLLVDQTVANHLTASAKIAELSDGNVAISVIFKHADTYLHELEANKDFSRVAPRLLLADTRAIRKLAPGEAKAIGYLVRIFKLPNVVRARNGVRELRAASIDGLKEWSVGQPLLKKKLAEIQTDDLKAFQQSDGATYSGEIVEVLSTLDNLAGLGQDATIAIPVIKELKLHSNVLIRKKAAIVLDALMKPTN